MDLTKIANSNFIKNHVFTIAKSLSRTKKYFFKKKLIQIKSNDNYFINFKNN